MRPELSALRSRREVVRAQHSGLSAGPSQCAASTRPRVVTLSERSPTNVAPGVIGSSSSPQHLARVSRPTLAALLGALSVATLLAGIPLQIILPASAGSALVGGAGWIAFGVAFTGVGVVVARREPDNALGWLLLAAALAIQLSTVAASYAYLNYSVHHDTLPLGPVAVLLSPGWFYTFLLVPLIVLLFPDGRVGRAWRWPLRAYGAVACACVGGLLEIAVSDLSLRAPLNRQGDLVGASDPVAWAGPLRTPIALFYVVFIVAALARQIVAYRRSRGIHRQQLKWLAAGAVICLVFLVVVSSWSTAPALIGNDLLPFSFAALPICMGIAILRYRLYEIDRLVSRTLAYAILTALLVGTFIGLVALSTDALALSGRIGVAASTLVAAALFNPLRARVQRLVDRRFNRIRYDAEAIVAAFTTHLRDAVELDAIRAQLLDAVSRAVEPTHASVWIRD
jgi:hypothetical protein